MTRTLALITTIGICLCVLSVGADADRVLMLRDGLPGSSEKLYQDLRQAVERTASVTEVGGTALSSTLDAETGRGSVLILANAVAFPADAKASLLGFLKRGNHLLAVSGPAFSSMVVNSNGHWVNRAGIRDELASAQGGSIVDFLGVDISKWQRASGTVANPTSIKVESSGDSRVPESLHVRISRLDNWDTLRSPQLEHPFAGGSTVTAFWAKGDPRTPELAVEWVEKDRSRWMSTVKLVAGWHRYALMPEDFTPWPDGSPADRGKPGDHFRPENAATLSFGLADGISHQDLGIAHEYWVSDVRAAPDPFSAVDFTAPVLESISPVYKVYKTKSYSNTWLSTGTALPAGSEVVCGVSRSPGYGSSTVSRIRYIPVVEGRDEKGVHRGSVAHILLNTKGDFAGSVWGFVGLDQEFLARHSSEYVPAIVSMLSSMRRGVFLASAGTDEFAYIAGERVKYGAHVVNLSSVPVAVTVRAEAPKTGWTGGSRSIGLPAGTLDPMPVEFETDTKPGAGEYNAVIQLTAAGGEVVDSVTQPFQVLKYARMTDRNHVTAKSGDFYLDGKKWYPFGINYWPLYSIGQEPSDYWLHWLSPEQYDPAVIERDLALAESLGMNLVSVQYGKAEHARTLMDFLARCDRHGVKAHVFVPGLDPIGQDTKLAQKMIRAAHLAESSTVFAYDLGWEVHIGPYDARKPHDRDWQNWVIDRYGSIESAEKDWGYVPKTADGFITGPTDDQLVTDGAWRIYVAAYRRFWDDKWSRGYQTVRAAVKAVDPYHLMGARSGWGGLGTEWPARSLPVDLLSGVKHIDFVSPEGYAVGGDRKGFLRGGFDNEYARYWSGGKPIYWAEYGSPLFGGTGPDVYNLSDSEQNLDRERDYYAGVLRMVVETYANGSAGWWWPGGLRVDEKSDFGIINPDGTPRPAALEFPKIAEQSKAPRQAPTPTRYLTMDRDKHISGFAGVYAELSGKWADLFMSGQYPGLKTAGTGTTSANTPLMAVGNVPCNGHNPPKYLNAEFNWVKVNGKQVENGSAIEVAKGKPVRIEASVGNTEEATWLAPKNSEDGAVYLNAIAGDRRAQGPISADAPFLGDASVKSFRALDSVTADTRVALRMTAKGRTDFGEVFMITLRPSR